MRPNVVHDVYIYVCTHTLYIDIYTHTRVCVYSLLSDALLKQHGQIICVQKKNKNLYFATRTASLRRHSDTVITAKSGLDLPINILMYDMQVSH